MMPDDYLHVTLSTQRLTVYSGGAPLQKYSVSTALKGAGAQMDSEKTPLGWHRIRAGIGAGCAAGTVFIARRPTGEHYSEALAAADPGRDWILTRILWLCGTESGKNRFGEVDSMRRYIYIHGCPDSEPMGEPRSHGCIRMRNQDVIELFEQVPAGMPVLIEE